MRRLKMLAVAALLAGAGLLVPASPALAAYLTYPFEVKSRYNGGATAGTAQGTLTFYNQSVGVQGSVFDLSFPHTYTQVRFTFYLDTGYTLEYASQTRTDNVDDSKSVSYNFTQDGPTGGIRGVVVRICTSGAPSCDQKYFPRV